MRGIKWKSRLLFEEDIIFDISSKGEVCEDPQDVHYFEDQFLGKSMVVHPQGIYVSKYSVAISAQIKLLIVPLWRRTTTP